MLLRDWAPRPHVRAVSGDFLTQHIVMLTRLSCTGDQVHKEMFKISQSWGIASSRKKREAFMNELVSKWGNYSDRHTEDPIDEDPQSIETRSLTIIKDGLSSGSFAQLWYICRSKLARM